MAKSNNRQVDKVERKARLAGVQRQRKIEQREFRSMERMGWQEINEDDEDLSDYACDDRHEDPNY